METPRSAPIARRPAWLIRSAMTLLPTAVFILMILPSFSPLQVPGADDLYHIAAFAVLIAPHVLWGRLSLAWPALLLLLFSAAIEVIQSYFGRGAEWTDLVSDAAGLALCAVLGRALRHFVARRRKGVTDSGSA